jgi:hypothetical protein
MSISKELFLALLSMDAYNRGYAPGIKGLTDDSGTLLGTASISKRLKNMPEDFQAAAQAAGFYAIAYEVGTGIDGLEPGTKVISYRGTDNASIATPTT